MRKILVTPRSVTKQGWHASLDRLVEAGFEVILSPAGKTPSEDELVALLSGCEGYLAGVEPISEKVLESAVKLKVISRNGVGINNIDISVAQRLSIDICVAPASNSRSVAELAFTFMLSLARSVPYSDSMIKQGKWERRNGIELKGRRLGIIGCGSIGRELAIMAIAFGMQVTAFDPISQIIFTDSSNFQYCSLDFVLSSSDFISLHCPPSSKGQPLVNHEFLHKLQQDAFLINTSRGELIDEDAVRQCLEEGRLSGYATDVFRQEPPELNALFTNDRVITTPHIGAFTQESVDRAMNIAVDNLLRQLLN